VIVGPRSDLAALPSAGPTPAGSARLRRRSSSAINVSPTHPLREALELVLGVSALFALALALIAWSVDIAVVLVPPETEARVFRSFWDDQAASGTSGLHADELERAQEILDRLAAHWPDAAYEFQIAAAARPALRSARRPS